MTKKKIGKIKELIEKIPKRNFQYKQYMRASRIDPDWRETGLEYRVTDLLALSSIQAFHSPQFDKW